MSSAAKVREWTERLARFSSGGIAAAKFCQAEGISLPSFYQWRRKLTAPAIPVQEPTRGPSALDAIELKPTASRTSIRFPGGAIEFSGTLK